MTLTILALRALSWVLPRKVASTEICLAARKGACRFATVLRPKKLRTAKQISVDATFLGNTQLKARSAKIVKVKVVRR